MGPGCPAAAPVSGRTPLDAPEIPGIDGELSSEPCPSGELQVAVIEHLRVQVPAAARAAWLEAEQDSWEPWLQRQSGYLGRQLRWDAEREEGQLLIRWASREQWHAIPRAEIEAVQERFERLAHAALVRRGLLEPLPPEGSESPAPANPFPLLLSEELPPAAAARPPALPPIAA
ncbi:MAG: TIGR03792 family protein [Synechococcaceae cyanobacterium]|nr:TIGR03792 family protein [Synechococcaceae cyanobacterium]